jgi:hypothetical protein
MHFISLCNTCRTIPYLIAVAVCVSLVQYAHADSPSVSTDKLTHNGKTAKNEQNAGQSKAPLKSKSFGNVRTDYTDICIFCHLPNMANHNISSPLWNCTVKAPAIIQKTKSEVSR